MRISILQKLLATFVGLTLLVLLATLLETEFSPQQLRISWLLGLASLILVFSVPLLLERGLLDPVRRMTASVALLSCGNYSHRMNESRGGGLGKLAMNLDRLGSTLEANQSSRKRLLANISQELRAPLAVLSGELDALQDGVREFNAKQLGSLSQEVQRLAHLVDDLDQLSVTDVGGLRYQFARVDMMSCIQRVIDGVVQRASAQGICVCLSLPNKDASASEYMVTADAQRIDQLLLNILDNSLAYTDAPGRVVISLSRTAASAVIVVDDTPPSSAVACEPAFDPLFRRDVSGHHHTNGAELSLAICRSIAAAHGGSIDASVSDIGGLSVRFEIPLVGAITA